MRRFKASARLRALGPPPKSLKTRKSFDIARGTDVAKEGDTVSKCCRDWQERSAQGSWDDACTPGL